MGVWVKKLPVHTIAHARTPILPYTHTRTEMLAYASPSGVPKVTACLVCHLENEQPDRCDRCGLLLRAAAAGSVALPPGTALFDGRFVIEEILGQGGHGVTYRCSDRERRCQVAIKEFLPAGCVRRGRSVRPPAGAGLAFGRALDNFLREARELHRLDHPSIIRVHLDFEENNTAYLVMEFVRGTNLLARADERGTLPEALALRYVGKVGDALGLVHRARLLHLDVKPENILATPDRRVVLIDFDCAREQREFGGGRMVTQGYSPLEQYIDDAPLGPFSDVYALAATLYHLLGGEAPPPAPDRARGVALRPLRALNPRVSAPIVGAVEAGLALYARDRPQRMGDFLNPLQEGLAQAAPPGRRLGEHAACIRAIAFSPDGHRLASAGDDRLVHLWNLATGEEERLGENPPARGGLVVTSLSNLSQRAPGGPGGPGAIYGLAFSTNGRLLAAASDDLWLWDLEAGGAPRPLPGHEGPITSIAFAPLAALLASGARDGAVRLWDPARDSLPRALGGHQKPITAVTFSPDGKLVASAGEDGKIWLWDLAGSGGLRLDGHAGAIRGLAFHPAGTQLASGGADGSIRLWDVARGRELQRLEGCPRGVTCIAFSPDGKTLAAGGEDFTVGLWHLATGWEDSQLSGHTGRLSGVAFSPDGKTLATASWDQTVRLWRVRG